MKPTLHIKKMKRRKVTIFSFQPVTAKVVIFSGYAVGTSLAGFLSDYIGRKAAIAFFSQLLFGTGIIATVMPDITGVIVVWFFVGKFQPH